MINEKKTDLQNSLLTKSIESIIGLYLNPAINQKLITKLNLIEIIGLLIKIDQVESYNCSPNWRQLVKLLKNENIQSILKVKHIIQLVLFYDY